MDRYFSFDSDGLPAVATRHICYGGKGGGGNSGGSNGNGTSTTINKTELPPWVDAAGQANLAQANATADNLQGPYTGQRVAGPTNGLNADIASLQNNAGSTNPAFSYAQQGAADVMGYNPAQVNPGSISGSNLDAYMNPYTQNVVNSGMQAIDMQRRQALNQVGDNASRVGAFGGSRQGVQEGVTNAAASMQAGQLASSLQQGNFLNAQNMAQQDVNNNMQGQLANQQAGISGAGLNLTAANGLGNLAYTGQQSFLNGTNAALQGQTLAQGNNQQQLDSQMQQYQDAQQFPLQQLQIKMGALGMTPYGQTQTSTYPSQMQGNSTMSTLGGVGAGLGILGSGLGVASGLLALSDRTEKTDIRKVGTDADTGLGLYAYRYKGDPKNYPKVVGPMAQEIAKKYPGAVYKVGDKLAVDFSFLGSPA